MAKSLTQILAEPDDFELCNGLFSRIVDHHGDDIDASAITEAERVVLLVWHVSGIVGNGGFRYLFEGYLKGDPDFALTAAAFQAIGCKEAAEAVRKTLAIFPDSRPPADIEERLRYYLKRIKGWPTDLDKQFFRAQDDLKKCLAGYIRSHADAFAHLDAPRVKRPKKKDSKPARAAARKKTGPSLADLPRWARVACAARCARHVFPLLAQHWPGIPSTRSDAVRHAIDLAEQSAAEARAMEGLKKAVMYAVMTAGAALMAGAEAEEGEPRPEDAHSGTIASFAAKAAEKAAQSARSDADDPKFAAMEAWNFATQAAGAAGEDEIVEQLNEDFLKLHRTAIRAGWTHRTPIPPEFWSML